MQPCLREYSVQRIVDVVFCQAEFPAIALEHRLIFKGDRNRQVRPPSVISQ